MKKRMIILLAFFVFLAAGTAFGTIWNVDFESNDAYTYKEPAVGPGPDGGIGEPCDVWNIFEASEGGTPAPVGMALVDSKDNAGGVSFTFTGNDGNRGIAAYGHSPTASNAVVGEYVWLGDGGIGGDTYNVDFEITGLSSGSSYDIYLYAGGYAANAAASAGCDITVDTDGDGDLGDETPVTVNTLAPTVVTGIVADVSGTIIGLFADNGGSESEWGGFQLEGAPGGEPVGGIDPCSFSLTEAAGASHSDTYVITIDKKLASTAEVRVYLDPCDLWADGLEQVTVLPAKVGDANTALDITFTSANWDTPVTVTITAVDDAIGELAVDLTLGHSLVLVSGAFDLEGGDDPNWGAPRLANSIIDVSVADDDQRYAVIIDDLDPNGIEVSETGPTSDDFTVVIEKQPTITITIDIATDGQTSLSSNALVFNSGNWNVAQTVTVTAVDDSVGETDPHTSDISYSVDPGVINWNALFSDNFNNTLEDGWTTYMNEFPDPCDPCAPYDANAVHDGSQLLTYGSTMALAPGDFTAPYRVTVECDLGDNAYNTIYLRNDGVSHAYENGDLVRIGWWDGAGGALILNISGNDHGQYGVPIPGRGTDPNVYRFIIEDLGNTVTVRMENVSNTSNYLEISGSGNYAGLGAGTKIALGLIEDDGTDQGLYCAYDNFAVDQLVAGQDEKIAWLGAPIEYLGGHDGDAWVNDNDCTAERATQLGDLDDDCDVDLADFALMAYGWMDCVLPNVPGCI